MDGNIIKYLSVFKMAGLDLTDAECTCRDLNKDTLDRLTKTGIDRRIIKPVVDEAVKRDSYNNLTDSNINLLLDDQNFIISLIHRYCI